ncbi:MAG TPA: outer membrane beta-barrel protein [Solimonas sp.]|nr:outer membrane beta-barrel protein [Solimonas sp.]
MNSFKAIIPVAALGALLAAPLASAAPRMMTPDSPSFYLGGGVGYNRIQDDQFPNQSDDLDDSNVSYKGIGGLRFNRIFGVEGQYIDFGNAEGGQNAVDATGWTAGIVANIPVFERITPYAKGGVLFWSSDRRFPAGSPGIQQERDGDGQDFTWGLGVKFALADQLDLRVEYEKFEFGDIDGDANNNHVDGVDVDTASANLVWNF